MLLTQQYCFTEQQHDLVDRADKTKSHHYISDIGLKRENGIRRIKHQTGNVETYSDPDFSS